MDQKQEHEEHSGQDTKEYDFLKETIKEKPMNTRKLMKRIAAFIGGAVLFGMIASLVIAFLVPELSAQISGNSSQDKITIPEDDPEEVPQEPEATPEPQVVEVPQELQIADYSKLYSQALTIAKEPMKALVTISGVTDDTNLLDNSSLTAGQSMGLVIANTGSELYILTEYEVTHDAAKLQAVLSDGTVADVTLKKEDDASGLAIVSLALGQLSQNTIENIAVAQLGNSYNISQGKPVIAIGSPSGYNDSVAFGTIVSSTNEVEVRDAKYTLLITDILSNSEGQGVLLDESGQVIGLMAQDFGNPEAQNMVKALGISDLKSLIETMSNGEAIIYMGVQGEDVTEEVSAATGIPQGVYVDAVDEDSPSMVAGIQSGDVIINVNGEEVTSLRAYSNQLQKCHSDQKIAVSLMRKGTEGYTQLDYEITLQGK